MEAKSRQEVEHQQEYICHLVSIDVHKIPQKSHRCIAF